MAFLDAMKARLIQLKAEADARAAANVDGEAVAAPDPVELARGCPGVRTETGLQGVTHSLRLGNWFGWFWLTFTVVHCYFMFKGLAAGKVEVNHAPVPHPSYWHFLGLALFYVPFFLVGFAFTMARYRVTLTDTEITVRWRILPFVGWTWRLAAGEEVTVRLAFRGAEANNSPVKAIVVKSQGKEISFASFLDEKKKAYLAAAIQDYYGVPPAEPSPAAKADFIA